MARRRGIRMGWLAAVALLLAACDSPTLAPSAAVPAGGPARLAAVASTAAADTAVAPAADSDTIWFPIGPVSTTGTWPDSFRLGLPGGDTITVRTLAGDSGEAKVVVGADTFVFQVGVWSNGSSSNGDFIGIIWKNGQFAGFWGHCSLHSNDWYFTRDPATGKIYAHWKNTLDPSTPWTYHYIYDPQRNVLKIYHRKPDGSVVLVYLGPPVKKTTNLPPPDPPAGHGPWTSEAQIAAASTSATTTGGGGATTTGTSAS
jgi:hypothetical protein